MKHSRGFTVIEVLVVLAFLIGGSVLFFTQKNAIDTAARDNDRKVAINAMYYSLEEYYYPKNGYYPQSIDSATLRTADPELFIDPDGYTIDDALSNYHYEATECSLDGKCESYKLYSDMEAEATYTKTSRR